MVRKPVCQAMRRTADVTDECRPLADLLHNVHGDLMNRQDGLRSLQCTRVGRDDDAGERCGGEGRSRRARLLEAERRQFRVFDPRIHARTIEVQVEIALPMAE